MFTSIAVGSLFSKTPFVTRTKLSPCHGHREGAGGGRLSGDPRGPQSLEDKPLTAGPSQARVAGWVGAGVREEGGWGRWKDCAFS